MDVWKRMRTPAAGLTLSLLILLASCGAGRPPAGPAFALVQRYGDGRTGTLTLRVSQVKVKAAEDVVLVVEAAAPQDSSVSLPEMGDALGQFVVAGRGSETRLLDPSGTVRVSRTFTLEPFLPGGYVIPSLTASFLLKGEGTPSLVTSTEIPVDVVSALPQQLGEQDLEGMPDPRGMASQRPLWIGLGSVGLAAVAAAAALWRRRWPVPRIFSRRLPSWDAALQELDRLLAAGLITRGEHDRFYQEMSGLVRRYVERRFAVRAPEQTTEEFLAAAVRIRPLTEHAPLLKDFLGACDLVKFARHTPARDEVRRAVDACRLFITSTAGAEAP